MSSVALESTDGAGVTNASAIPVYFGSNDVERLAYLVVATADPSSYVTVSSVTDEAGLIWTRRSQTQIHHVSESGGDEEIYLTVETWFAYAYAAYPEFELLDIQLSGTAAQAAAMTSSWFGTSGFDPSVTFPSAASDDTGDTVPAAISGNNLATTAGGRMVFTAICLDATPNGDSAWSDVTLFPSLPFDRITPAQFTQDFDSDVDGSGIVMETDNNLANFILVGDAFAAGAFPAPPVAPLPVVTIVSQF